MTDPSPPTAEQIAGLRRICKPLRHAPDEFGAWQNEGVWPEIVERTFYAARRWFPALLALAERPLDDGPRTSDSPRVLVSEATGGSTLALHAEASVPLGDIGEALHELSRCDSERAHAAWAKKWGQCLVEKAAGPIAERGAGAGEWQDCPLCGHYSPDCRQWANGHDQCRGTRPEPPSPNQLPEPPK